MKRIEVLVFQGCGTTPAIGAFELFRKANQLNESLDRAGGRQVLDVRLVALSRSRTVKAADGYELRCSAPFEEDALPHLVVVPAFDGDILAQLHANRDAVEWLSRRYQTGATLASECTGAFALAEAGLLDGLPVTTHWAAQDLLCRRYPAVKLRPQDTLVDAGRIITCGGAYSYVNLIIYLLDRLVGRDVAMMAARVFLIDVNKAPQGSYAVLSGRRAHGDALIDRVQDLIEERLAGDFSIEVLAKDACLSRRQLLRRFKDATGMTLIEYIQRARVEAAKRALAETREPLDEIAWAVGYTDAPGFRKLFTRLTGLTPGEYRKRNRVAWQAAPR